ncbi:hypothetical protein E2P81_ATG05638 [Venturia nashicola]|uniref:Tat pathway signal sequence n=1 Tax=Venturia nashicola TaxID=86259 RepID=A0A4Z1P8Z4_9PEZI|nr:hypothetical protein E6O75_ATG05776 [Venturia nashicola]TLD32662.1 hypothetical protein E2P81_ATG05638 [Venturia nashicola]
MASQRYSRDSSSRDSQEGLIAPELPEHFASYESKVGINYFWRFCLILNFLLLLGNVVFTVRRFGYHVERCSAAKNADYTALKNLIKHESQYFNLTFGDHSPYTKPFSPEVDALWDEISAPPGKVGFVAVEKEELERMNVSSIAISDGRGRYLATIDVFHQLHCLKMLYMAATHQKIPGGEKEDVWADHIAHCTDSIRLSLQCSADASLLTFKWVKNFANPIPDFRSYHTCRNFDDILDYAKENMVDVDRKDLWIHPIYGSLDQNFSHSDNRPKPGTADFLPHPA